MNSNGREIEFRTRGGDVGMWVERDCAPYDCYLCGSMRKDDEGFFRFHPEGGVVMTCKMLYEAAKEASRLNQAPLGHPDHACDIRRR